MGRINDLWKKIKGLFNKNKTLPEGKNVPEEVGVEEPKNSTVGNDFLYSNKGITEIELPSLGRVGDSFLCSNEEFKKGLQDSLCSNEKLKKRLQEFAKEFGTEKMPREEVREENKREKFLEGIRESAEKFVPERMPREEVIMKLLKDKGLSEELANNPVARKQITHDIDIMLYDRGIETITSTNFDKVSYELFNFMPEKSLLEEGIKQNFKKLEITENGGLRICLAKTSYEAQTNTINEGTFFRMDDGNFQRIEVAYIHGDKMNPGIGLGQLTTEKTYNDKGIVLRKEEMWQKWNEAPGRSTLRNGYRGYGNLVDHIAGHGGTITDSHHIVTRREPDLVTAHVDYYPIVGSKNYMDKSSGYMFISLQHPNELNTQAGFGYDKFRQAERTTDNGFVAYKDSETRDRIIKENQQYAFEASPELREMAKENGLIKDEEENELEQ